RADHRCKRLTVLPHGGRGSRALEDDKRRRLRTRRARATSRCHPGWKTPTHSARRPAKIARRKTSGIAREHLTMTVKIRQYKKTDMHEVDITFRWPDGSSFRERRRSPVTGKVASMRWGQ